jgi:hypothetical protein
MTTRKRKTVRRKTAPATVRLENYEAVVSDYGRAVTSYMQLVDSYQQLLARHQQLADKALELIEVIKALAARDAPLDDDARRQLGEQIAAHEALLAKLHAILSQEGGGR